MKRLLWIVLGWLVLSFAAHAASFDCAKARSKVEKMICGDAELSKLDDDLAAVYHEALASARYASAYEVGHDQIVWLHDERNRCKDVLCLKNAYKWRIGYIATQTGTSNPASSTNMYAVCLKPRIDWRDYEWTLITGKGMAACEDMLAYLKSRPKEAPPPVCPADRLPSNGNWSRPETRILSETEKQTLIRDMPEKWRKLYEGPFKRAELMRVIRADITRDGIPETLLAYGSDNRQNCAKAAQCASKDEFYKKALITISYGDSDYYNLLPMDDAGTRVDWSLGVIGDTPMLMGGELIFYKGVPYWLSMAHWDQGAHDDPNYSIRTDDPYNAMFGLYEISAGNSRLTKGIGGVGLYNDPEDRINPGCRFGYFHHQALKQ